MRQADRSDTDSRISRGTVVRAGLLGGLAFVLFKMAMAVVLGGDAFTPLRLIGAMVVGEQALSSSSPLVITAMAALSMHLALSFLYAGVFSAMVTATPPLRRNRMTVLLAGGVMGLVLWGMNLYLFAPIFFPWFTETRPLVEIAARVLFFGIPVGYVVSSVLPFNSAVRPTTPSPSSPPREIRSTERAFVSADD